MAVKNNPAMLEAAERGYLDRENPYLWSSPCWEAYEAGRAIARAGISPPIKAASSRGHSVRLESINRREFLVTFSGRDLEISRVELVR